MQLLHRKSPQNEDKQIAEDAVGEGGYPETTNRAFDPSFDLSSKNTEAAAYALAPEATSPQIGDKHKGKDREGMEEYYASTDKTFDPSFDMSGKGTETKAASAALAPDVSSPQGGDKQVGEDALWEGDYPESPDGTFDHSVKFTKWR